MTVVDRHNYHLFQPLLYQVATAGLSPGDIASPIRGILHRQRNARVILAKVSGMTWATVRALINMRDNLSGMKPTDIQACKATYERLRPSTAQQVLRFHRMQQTAAAPPAAG